MTERTLTRQLKLLRKAGVKFNDIFNFAQKRKQEVTHAIEERKQQESN